MLLIAVQQQRRGRQLVAVHAFGRHRHGLQVFIRTLAKGDSLGCGCGDGFCRQRGCIGRCRLARRPRQALRASEKERPQLDVNGACSAGGRRRQCPPSPRKWLHIHGHCGCCLPAGPSPQIRPEPAPRALHGKLLLQVCFRHHVAGGPAAVQTPVPDPHPHQCAAAVRTACATPAQCATAPASSAWMPLRQKPHFATDACDQRSTFCSLAR